MRLNNRLTAMIGFLHEMTIEHEEETGGFIIKDSNSIRLTNLVRGENHEIFLEPQVSLDEDEEYLGLFHAHPTTNHPSPHDILTFLAQHEILSIVTGADGSIHVMLKLPESVKVSPNDVERLKEKYDAWYRHTEKFAEAFRFAYWRGLIGQDLKPIYLPTPELEALEEIDDLAPLLHGLKKLPDAPAKKWLRICVRLLK